MESETHVPERDALAGIRTTYDVLDKGFLRLIDCMPRMIPEGWTADYAVAQAARVSFGQGLKGPNTDADLIRYLLRHHHTSPFEMCEVKFHCKLPIFVARQWIRHRTANVNEMSGRYTVLKNEFFRPQRWRQQSKNNKQGGEVCMDYESGLYESCDLSLGTKGEGSAEDMSFVEYDRRTEAGVSRELARTCLPVSTYTEWYWKCDLHNILNFLARRMDGHAQMEMRLYASAMHALLAGLFPVTLEAWRDYVFEAVTLTRMEVRALRATVWNARESGYEFVQRPHISPSQRECDEWAEKRELLGLQGVVDWGMNDE